MKRVCAIGIPNDDEDLRLLLENLSSQRDFSFYIEPIDPTSRKLCNFIDLLLLSPSKRNISLIELALDYFNLPVVVVLPLKGGRELPSNLYTYINRESTLILVTYRGEPFIKTGIRLITKISNRFKLEVGTKEFLQLKLSPSCSLLEKFKEKRLLKRSSLSFKEALVLKLLFERPGEVIPYNKFLELGIKEESLPVYISKLRRVIRCLEPSITIRSNRRNGYALAQGL
jgi:hypothetical protein